MKQMGMKQQQQLRAGNRRCAPSSERCGARRARVSAASAEPSMLLRALRTNLRCLRVCAQADKQPPRCAGAGEDW